MENKELRQKLSRLQSKVQTIQFEIQDIIRILDKEKENKNDN